MESFEYPFFNNSLKISYTDKGVVEMCFQNKKAKPLLKATALTKKVSKALDQYLEGQVEQVNVPVDWQNLKGTDFQKKVWKKMSNIPFGKVKTYGELAEALHSPGAARAVGTACAKNPVLLAIPCHRVVGVNGLGGFSGGGLSVKRKLLQLENSMH